MTRSRQILLMTTALVLCAGLVVGRLSARLVPPPMPQRDHSPSWLQDQLGLSTEQRQQMDAIWADTKTRVVKTFHDRDDLNRQRDQAIHEWLTPQQLMVYEAIYDDFRDQRQQLDKQRDELIKSAEERSRALLSDSQKAQWDTLTKDMHEHHGGPHGPGGMHGPPPHMDSGHRDGPHMGPPPGP